MRTIYRQLILANKDLNDLVELVNVRMPVVSAILTVSGWILTIYLIAKLFL